MNKEQIIDRINLLDIIYKNNLTHLPGSFSMIEYMKCVYNNILLKDKDSKLIIDKAYSSAVYHYLFKDTNLDNIIKDKDYNLYSTEDIPCNAFGVAIGIALGSPYKLFINVGDSGLMNGLVHESLVTIGSKSLNKIVLLVDGNKKGVNNELKYDVNLNLYFNSLKWNYLECNGHDVIDINNILNKLFYNKPTCIYFNTIKGYGIQSLEDKHSFPLTKKLYDMYRAKLEWLYKYETNNRYIS